VKRHSTRAAFRPREGTLKSVSPTAPETRSEDAIRRKAGNLTRMKHAMANLVKLGATAGLVISLGSLGGCSSEERCSYNHQSYPKGASFPDKDGCNTCTCVAGGAVECTLMGCLGDASFEHPATPPDARDAAVDAPPDAPLPIDTVKPEARDTAIAETSAGEAPPIDTAAPDAPWPVDTAAPDGGSPTDDCTLPTALEFYVEQWLRGDSGVGSYMLWYQLDNKGLLITRDWWNGWDADYIRTCTPALPACGLPDQITVRNVVVDLADPAVKAAFASPPDTTFGLGGWPPDALTISTDTAGPIRVGLPCGDPDAGPCRPIPPALQRLRDDLLALAAAGMAQPACAELLNQ
jgi:hypothetical protein